MTAAEKTYQPEIVEYPPSGVAAVVKDPPAGEYKGLYETYFLWENEQQLSAGIERRRAMLQEDIDKTRMRSKTREDGLVVNCPTLLHEWGGLSRARKSVVGRVYICPLFHTTLPVSFLHIDPIDQGKSWCLSVVVPGKSSKQVGGWFGSRCSPGYSRAVLYIVYPQ